VTFDQPGLTSDFDATAIGGSFELGYKFDLGSGLFANPLGQLAYVSSRIDDGRVGSAPVAFDDGDSLRGRAGLRIGLLETVGSLAVEPYVEAYLMHEFTGDDRAWVYDYPAAPSGLGSWGMAGGGVQVMAANLTATLLFSIIHRRPLAFGYPQGITRFLSMAVHKRPFAFVPIRIFC